MNARPGGSRISHYRITGELGRDSIGQVLRAIDEMLDRPVALKVVHAAEAFPPAAVAGARERFRRDAQRAARIEHPALVTIYGFEQVGGADIIVMELVEGDTLKEMLARGERWRALDAAALVARIADAVAAAHARHVVHGHLSIGNVKITSDGRLKVLDLGIPKVTPEEVAAHAALATGAVDAAPPPPRSKQDDVVALARITCNLITGAIRSPEQSDDPDSAASDEPVFPDPARVLNNFGVLAPILARALKPAGAQRFADAAEFRNALVEVVRVAHERPAAEAAVTGERGGLHVQATAEGSARAPERHGVTLLDGDPALAPLERFPAERTSPALVLPPDLADRTTVPSGSAFVVMGEATMAERMRMSVQLVTDRLAEIRWGRTIAIAAVLAILAAGALLARQFVQEGGSPAALLASILGRGDGTADGGPALALNTGPGQTIMPADSIPSDSVVLADSGAIVEAADSATATDSAGSEEPASVEAPEPASAEVRTALVTAAPAGTTITVPGVEGQAWLDRVELSVSEGDSIPLRFLRRGYVPQTRVFRGEPIRVTLEPDSVTVRFEANTEAEVFLLAGTGNGEPVRLGSTDLTTRLPTGTYRILYRVPNQDDWITTGNFLTPGEQFTVSKTDYATHGDLLATVVGGWAFVSVDGGEQHETPYRFNDLPAGQHVLRLTRDGFQTIVDTVIVRGGQVTTRQYTLRR